MPWYYWVIAITLSVYLWSLRGTSLRSAYQNSFLRIYDNFNQIHFSGYRVLVCDIENTLARRGRNRLSPEILATFKRAWEEGIREVVLLSNKRHKGDSGDFTLMARQLGDLGFLVHLQQPGWGWLKWPRKPYRFAFRRALRHSLVYRDEPVLAVGDKLRFDILRPIRMGWGGALVNPLDSDGRGDKWALIRYRENLTMVWNGIRRLNQPTPNRWDLLVALVVTVLAAYSEGAHRFNIWVGVAAGILAFLLWCFGLLLWGLSDPDY